MYFSINAYTDVWGLNKPFRLQRNLTWKEIDDPNTFSTKSDFLFITIDQAHQWLKSQNNIQINGQSIDPNEKYTSLSFDKFKFEIIVHRLAPPKNVIFSKEDLAKILLRGKDSLFNILYINFDGELFLNITTVDSNSRFEEYAVRFETLGKNTGYVGSKLDNDILSEIYICLLEGWEEHLISNRKVYRDFSINDRTENELILSIKSLFATEQDEAALQAFINDPELGVWYKELPQSSEEELRKLRTIWEMIKSEKNK